MLVRTAIPLLLFLAVGCSAEDNRTQNNKVRLALATEPFSFDPLHADSTSNQIIQRQVFETLLEYHPTKRPFALQGLLAKSWHASDDGLTWEFTLKQDAAFHDPETPPLWPNGTRKVEAKDVLESWLRHADFRNESRGWWAFEGLIRGLDAFRKETAKGKEEAVAAWDIARKNGIEGFSILSPQKFRISLDRVDSQFGNRVASSYFAVIPAEARKRAGNEFLNRPVGSGPFVVHKWTPRVRLLLKATPNWRGQNDPFGGSTLPGVTAVDIQVVKDGHTRTLMFKKGEIDRLSPTQDSFDAFIENGFLRPETSKIGIKLLRTEPSDLTMVAFDMKDPIVGDISGDIQGNKSRRLLRQALACAFPYGRWHNLIRNGTWALPADSFLPPVLKEANNAPPFPWNIQNLDLASKFLSEAGYPGGKGLPTLQYELSGTDPISRSQGDLFVDALARIGIKCKAIPNPWHEFVSKTRQGRAQIFARLWAIDWPSAGNILELFFGPHKSPGINHSRFQHDGYDQLFRDYRVTTNSEQGNKLAHSMLEILNKECPAFPIDHRQGYLLVQPWLIGTVLHPFDPLPCKYLRVDPAR